MNSNLMMASGNNNGNGGNFDWNQIANIVGATSMNVQGLSNQMGIVVAAVDDMRNDIGAMKDDIYQIKYNGEITNSQSKTLAKAVKRRVYEILSNNPYEIAKYSKSFMARCWKESKDFGGVAEVYKETQKGDFQRAINYIEAWIPIGGCAKLKAEIDEKANARKKARFNGYEA